MNATELINYTKDIDFEYNVKLILLSLITIYAVIGWWFYKERKAEYLYQWYLKKIVLVLSKAWIAVGPLWVFFLARTVPLDVILRPLIVLYGVATLLFAFSILVFGGEKIKEFFTGEGFYRER